MEATEPPPITSVRQDDVGRGMFKEWRRRRALRKIKPGTGRPLKPFRFWQVFARTIFHLRLDDPDGTTRIYSVDAVFLDVDFDYRADLYLDGRHHARSSLPATFPVPGGVIEVAASTYGLKRIHHVPDDGPERVLEPDPRSAEGLRARLAEKAPRLSRAIGVAAVVILLVALPVALLQLAELVTGLDAVAEHIDPFTSPLTLPGWAAITLTALALTAAVERALTLRNHWLIDMETGWFDG